MSTITVDNFDAYNHIFVSDSHLLAAYSGAVL